MIFRTVSHRGEGASASHQHPLLCNITTRLCCDQWLKSKPLLIIINIISIKFLQVQIYSSTSHQVIKSVSRFTEAAYSGCFRGDGKLLAAGGHDGAVKVFEVNSRAILRQFKGHTKYVHVRTGLESQSVMIC